MEGKIKNIVFEVNEELLKLFGEKIKRIILYGSYARGDFNLESDIEGDHKRKSAEGKKDKILESV